MASIKNILFLFAILVSSTWAQGPSNSSNHDEPPSSIPPPYDGSSDGPPAPLASSAPGRFDHFAFKGPKFDWPAEFPGAGFFRDSHRQKRQADRRVINCNFSAVGLTSCTGCHEIRRCYPTNKGVISTCTGLFQYCNNGQCSTTKGPLCDVTTSSTSTASTTESTSTTDSSSTTGSSTSTSSSSTSTSTTAQSTT